MPTAPTHFSEYREMPRAHTGVNQTVAPTALPHKSEYVEKGTLSATLWSGLRYTQSAGVNAERYATVPTHKSE